MIPPYEIGIHQARALPPTEYIKGIDRCYLLGEGDSVVNKIYHNLQRILLDRREDLTEEECENERLSYLKNIGSCTFLEDASLLISKTFA